MKLSFGIVWLCFISFFLFSLRVSCTVDSSAFAVQLVERIIHHKKLILLPESGIVTYDRYEKYNAGFTNLTPKEEQIFLFNYVNFVRLNKDTSDLTEQPINYILTKERFESIAQQCTPPYQERTWVRGSKNEWIDLLGHDQGIRAIVDEILTGINLYDDTLKTLLGQTFIGPFSSSLATKVYNYKFIGDGDSLGCIPTIWIECAPKFIHLRGVKGKMKITNELHPKVLSVNFVLANAEYLNFIDQVTIKQEYEIVNGTYRLMKSDISTELSVFKLFLRRSFYYSNYQFHNNLPPLFSTQVPISYDRDAYNKPDIFWTNIRPIPIRMQEERVRSEASKMIKRNQKGGRGIWSYVGDLIINNKISLGAVDLTPVFSYISRNDIEGYRFRLGGMTNSKMSPHFFLKGYGAYGDKDKLFKYNAEAIYSFFKQDETPYNFPQHYVSLKFARDMKTPGQELLTVDKDNAFYSFRQTPLERMLLVKEVQAQYNKEFNSGLGFRIGMNVRGERAAGLWRFQEKGINGTINDMPEIRVTDAELALKYAPNEKFYQSRTYRRYLTRYSPVISLSHKIGFAGLLKGQYTYHKTEFAFNQTYAHPIIGEFRSWFKLGKLWSNVPAPLLFYPQANPSWFNIRESYNMMNVMEFAYDSYASIDIEHHFNGLFFNFIPANRWGKLREVIGIKSIWGNLSSKNKSGDYQNKYLLPVNLNGDPISFAPGTTPYAECSVGIENILRFIRLDYVWRLTYLDRPNISKSGLRISVNIRF